MLSEMLSTQIGYKKSGDYFNHTISVLYFRINGISVPLIKYVFKNSHFPSAN